jgi:DNA recombination protein RmuC
MEESVEILVVVLVVIDLLLAAVTLGVVLRERRPGGGTGSDASGAGVREAVDALRPDLYAQQSAIGERLAQSAGLMDQRLQSLTESLGLELARLRQDNAQQLDRMRATVDERLHSTLEHRLGESFRTVSERLEQVQQGLGEMHSLAADVGGLKRVLTNVKNRGGLGELQLERQLADCLTPDQYATEVVIRPGSAERVEFALRLPGGDDHRPVWLPIDSKFPQEDYERLLAAQEAGDQAAADRAGRELERAVRVQARRISEKYVVPPYSTDFAIMYLPTEGLFAEVLRRPGLVSDLQSSLRVLVSGPTTLMALLNSLQMGFRTLAIEQRTAEVWEVLAQAKTEFARYGQVWERLARQLQTAQNTVEEVGRRTRAVQRRLRDVEAGPDDALAGPETGTASSGPSARG